MRGMPFNFQGNKGVLEISKISSSSSSSSSSVEKWNKEIKSNSLGREPTSVLDTIRSPSPPTTSSSTLSSSLGGNNGSTDTAGVAAVSGNPSQKWPVTQEDNNSSAVGGEPPPCSGNRKDEWVSELQPVTTTTGLEKSGGLGLEDWESMLSETAVSPSQEQSLLRWLGDVGPSEFEGNSGFGLVDPCFGFDSIGSGSGSAMNVSFGGSVSPSLAVPTAGFSSNFNKFPNFGSNSNNPIFSPQTNNLRLPISSPTPPFYQQQQQQQHFESSEEKPQILNPQLLINHPTQHQSFFLPLPYTQQDQQHLFLQQQQQQQQQQQSKRQHVDPTSQIPKNPFVDTSQEIFIRKQQQQGFPHQLVPNHLQQRPTMLVTKPKVLGSSDEAAHLHHQHQQQQQQVLIDQLFKAAELIETGNLVHARGILARLNHQLVSPVGKPLQRAAFYFKEALQLLLLTNNNVVTSPPQRISNSTPFDVLLKIGSYKAFSEMSPILQFTNFTCNQALLEALDGFNHIHIIDFEIGLGEQWASFMQEIAVRIGGAPSLKITTFTSASSQDHPLELALTRENLSHFANELGISFGIEIVSLVSFDPASWSLAIHVSNGEAVAVNLPIGSPLNHPSSFPSLLRLVKQLSPKIVVSVDRGCERNNLSFVHHFHHALHLNSILLDSLDAINTNSDTVNKIERYLVQPRIESSVLRRHLLSEKMPPWRNLFASAGFAPFNFSNFTETQAECMLKRLQVRGFHVEKHQASLVLFWQRRELVSVSAWSC